MIYIDSVGYHRCANRNMFFQGTFVLYPIHLHFKIFSEPVKYRHFLEKPYLKLIFKPLPDKTFNFNISQIHSSSAISIFAVILRAIPIAFQKSCQA